MYILLVTVTKTVDGTAVVTITIAVFDVAVAVGTEVNVYS